MTLASHWLDAFALSYPFASEGAFEMGLTELESSNGAARGATAGLRGRLHEELRARGRGMSVASIRQIVQHSWDPAARADGVIPLSGLLRRIASVGLEADGGRAVVRTDPNRRLSDALARWRWISLALPPDLVVGALFGASQVPVDASPRLVVPSVRALLREPVAETHLHLSAALSFELFWSCLMLAVEQGSVAWGSLRGAPFETPTSACAAPPRAAASGYRARLLQAALARRVLAKVLNDPFTGVGSITRMFERLSKATHGSAQLLRRVNVLRTATDSLMVAKPSDADRLQLALQFLASRSPRSFSNLRDVRAADPLRVWAGGGPVEATLVRRALQRIEHGGEQEFAKLFWQYTRIRCLVYRYLVIDPGTAGLDWFCEHFFRIDPHVAAILDRARTARIESALELGAKDLRLGALEARIRPKNSWSELASVAANALRATSPGTEETERGLVLHFLRRAMDGTHQHSDPATGGGFRYGRWYIEERRRLLATRDLLRFRPAALAVVRGFDVANDELAVPNWVLVGLFEEARQSAHAAAVWWRSRGYEPPTVGTTIHAGEDFRTLHEALRRIHELVEFGIVRHGDRLGHAIALGTRPERWMASGDRTLQPREDRLFDLVWEHDLYSRGRLEGSATRVAVIERRIAQLGTELFGSAELTSPLDDLRTLRRRLHQPQRLRTTGFPACPWRAQLGSNADQRLLALTLTSRSVWLRAREPVEVRHDSWELAFVERAQKWLITELARHGVSVECNPSSNLLVGDIGRLDHLPAFVLQPGASAIDAERRGGLAVSINSDDPLTFATRLADEYAYVHGALERDGLGTRDALNWLEEARRTGWRSRFTWELTRSASNREKIAELIAPRPGGARHA